MCNKKIQQQKKETKAYETIVKNNKNIPVEIEVLDQYPISKNNDIEVTLEEADGAQITGITANYSGGLNYYLVKVKKSEWYIG